MEVGEDEGGGSGTDSRGRESWGNRAWWRGRTLGRDPRRGGER